MAITLTCSECERALKLKDELAGRKIKCPGCQAVLTVPAPRDNAAIAAGAPAAKKKPPPPLDDEPEGEEEERPRKKKKKKKSSRGLVLGLVGGAILLIAGGGLFFWLQGGPSPPPKVAAAPKIEMPAPEPPQPKEERKREQISRAGRVMEKPEVQNLFHQLKLAYANYDADRPGKAPSKLEDIAPYLENNQKLLEPMRKGWIVLVYDVPPQRATDALIAWEHDEDPNGIRFGITGSFEFKEMNRDEFKMAKKAGKN